MNSKVKLLLVPAVVAALGLAACDETPETHNVRVCVNKDTMQRVEDTQCTPPVAGATGYFPYYWWYMYGVRTYPYVGTDVRTVGTGSFNYSSYNAQGSNLSHSSFETVEAHAAVGSTSVSRGGFGSSARGFSGGGFSGG